MATNYLLGTAVAVAQVSNATVGGTLAGETFTISVNGLVIASHTDTTTVIADTVAALVAAWNASTHPYATGITATDASPAVVLTADTAGVLFIVTVNTPGGAATFTLTTPTASSGPRHADDATNWSLGAVPVATDDVVLADSAVDLSFGLECLAAVVLGSLTIKKTYTGKIGLDYATFEGAAAAEYRPCYFKFLTDGVVSIGEHTGPGTPSGSRRIMLNTHTTACTIVMHGTASTPYETGRPACRILCNNAANKIEFKGAAGGFGIACDKPGETSTFHTCTSSAPVDTHKIFISMGCTYTLYEQTGGDSLLGAAANVDTVAIDGGQAMTEEGDFRVVNWHHHSGTSYPNHLGDGVDPAIAVLNIHKGTVDGTRSNRQRTWSAVDLDDDHARLVLSGDVVTISALTQRGGANGIGGI